MKSDDDQEVAGIFHPLDDLELEGEPLAVFLARCGRARGRAPRCAARGPPRRARAAPRPRRPRWSPTEKRGRIGLRGARPERAALGDLDGRGQRLRQVGEQRRHLGAALEVVLGGELPAVGLGDHAALGDADQRVVRLVVLALGEERLVGGDQRNALRVGELDQRRLGRALGRACRGAAIRHRAGRRTAAASVAQRAAASSAWPAAIAASSGPPGPPVSAIRPSVAPSSQSKLQMRLLVRRRFEEGARAKAASGCGSPPRARRAARSAAARRARPASRGSRASSPKSTASAQPTIGWMP